MGVVDEMDSPLISGLKRLNDRFDLLRITPIIYDDVNPIQVGLLENAFTGSPEQNGTFSGSGDDGNGGLRKGRHE